MRDVNSKLSNKQKWDKRRSENKEMMKKRGKDKFIRE